jgi:uncharacterized membrane protein
MRLSNMTQHALICRGFLVGLVLLTGLLWGQPVWAQDAPTQQYAKANVEQIDKQGTKKINGYDNIYQEVTLKILDGPDAGQIIHVEHGGTTQITAGQKVSVGQTVVLTTFTTQDGQTQHIIVDSYRLPWLIVFGAIFVMVLLAVTGWKGLGSLAGLVVSLAVIAFWVTPQILHGGDPLLISIAGSAVILLVTTYLAHGISRQTSVALVATFGSLIVTGVLAIITVNVARITGISSEEVYSLQLNQATATINTQGLLLGGIIIGTLGALNDVTTTQSATVFELVHSMTKPTLGHVVGRSLVIGREHILSLVNTLVLAYAGASLAIFLFFILNPSSQPLWVMINSETVFDEVLRTIVGSFGLILAVPAVTLLAAWSALRHRPTEEELAKMGHHH